MYLDKTHIIHPTSPKLVKSKSLAIKVRFKLQLSAFPDVILELFDNVIKQRYTVFNA